jgi:CheY-like chemotaxis protein
VTAASGGEGLEILSRKAEDFKVVLLDMMMPDMDGRQVYRELRKGDPDIPVVFVSGFTGEAHLEDLSGMGAQGFLQKPCGRLELGRLLKRILLP